MRPHIIHDSRRFERYDLLMAELNRQRITDYEIFPCIIDKSVIHSINASHKMLVQMAKDAGMDEICIMEDDVVFPHIHGWQYFLENKPNEFDLYLSGTYVVPIEQKQIVGFHCYIVRSCAYDKFLSVPDDVHIDTAMQGIMDFHICYPFAAIQRDGYSANTNRVELKNRLLRPFDVYGGIPNEATLHNIQGGA